MSWVALLTLISTTLLPIGVAIYFGYENRKLARANIELQKRLLAIEEDREEVRKKTAAKAFLQARIIEHGRAGHKLFIENTGNGPARNIVIKMDDLPFNEHPIAVRGVGEINVIGPGAHVTKVLTLTLARRPPFQLKLTWDDDSGERGEYQTTLTL